MIDAFKRENMLTALQQMAPATSFLLDTFFPTKEFHDTDTVTIDIIDSTGRKIAPFQSPLMQGKVMRKKGFENNTYKIPYIKVKDVCDAEKFLNRDAGQTIYEGGVSPMQKAEQEVGKALAEFRNQIVRRKEWMASQLLQNGKVMISGEGVAPYEIDFKMKSTHKVTLTGNDAWSATTTSDPIGDLEDIVDVIGKDSGLPPTDAVFGSDAWTWFRKNVEVQKELDTKNYNMGTVAPQVQGGFVTRCGFLPSANLTIWKYTELFYDEESDTNKPFVPANMVFVGSRSAYTRQHFGVIRDLKAGLNAQIEFFAKSWEVEDPSTNILLVQSSPMVAMHQVDAFARLTVGA